MTRDDIIRMARAADLWMTSDERIESVERFAAIVAAAEREACALVVEDMCWHGTPYSAADAIRARGETK